MTRDFKGIWIPKHVWLNKKLTIMEKLFMAEIDSLDNQEGCFASNAHFSEFFGISKNRCTEIIKSLETKGILTITLERKGKQIVKRILKLKGIRKIEQGYSENRDNPIRKTEQPYSENREGNNTSINNTLLESAHASTFLKNNYPSQFETFEMQFKSQIKNYEKFTADFNDTVLDEGKEFTDKLFGRLRKYARNWIENQNRLKVIKNEPETLNQSNKHLDNAI